MTSVAHSLAESAEANELAISLEIFVPSQLPACLPSMRSLLTRLSRTEPLFLDIVCGGGMEVAQGALDLATFSITECGMSCSLHLAACEFEGEEAAAGLLALLARARAVGVASVVVELGPPGRPHARFPTTAQFVAYIKAAEPALCVGVVGHPPDSSACSFEEGVADLAASAAAGAEFVLAQHTFSAQAVLRLVLAVKAARLCLPIIPAIPLLTSREAYSALAAATGARLPPEEEARLLAHTDRAAFRAAAAALALALCRDLLASGAVDALHFLTFNAEPGLQGVLEELGLYRAREGAGSRRKLPWRLAPMPARRGEDVRPLFWCNRSASYIGRTAGWANFPSGRWGSSVALSSTSAAAAAAAPAPAAADGAEAPGSGEQQQQPVTASTSGGRVFGALHPELLLCNAGTVEERRQMWGQNPTTPQDVWRVFEAYVAGRIPRLPWCSAGGIASETGSLTPTLAALNAGGFLTINSQPGVAGVGSEDPAVGWGGSGGLVYQKAYLLCFCPPGHLAALMRVFAEGGSGSGSSGSSSSSGSAGRREGEGYPSITYHAVDASGTWLTNSAVRESINTVTWGVFPDREIQTPTVMDPASFVGAWREEAFELWTAAWAGLYPPGEEAHSLLCDIAESYYMVIAVDNNFVGGGEVFPAFVEALGVVQRGGGKAAGGGEADPKGVCVVLEQQKAAQAAALRMAKLRVG
jgi:methylenetetrahydrofolate reductase (NADPH)